MSLPVASLTVLDWHQARRRSGVGTVTVLVGPPGPGLRGWTRWAAADGRPTARTAAADPSDVLRAWAAEAFTDNDPTRLALEWVRANAAGPLPIATPRTRHDLDITLRTLSTDPTSPAATAAYDLLAAVMEGRPADLGRLSRPFAGVCALLPERRWPALLLAPPVHADLTEWVPAALGTLAAVAEEVPGLPVAVCVPAAAFAAAVPATRTDRVATLAREGAVAVPTVGRGELDDRLRAAGVDPPPAAAALDRLTAEGLSAEVADASVEAAGAVRRAAPADVADDFRSVHERFLFEQLESLPETAGLFRPNRTLPFAHGGRAAEADLLCEDLKLVVEVDGAHYHLNLPQYRRDRRKDWLYQVHGYAVLRFLAEDVVECWPEIADAVLGAVAARRPGPPNEEPAG